MTGTTASITVSAKLPGLAVAPSLLSVGTTAAMPAGAPGATPTLAAFVDLMLGQAGPPPQEQSTDERQDDAASGKSLPDKDESDVDPALAWLLSATPIVPPVPQPVARAATGTSAISGSGDTPTVTLPLAMAAPQTPVTPADPVTPGAPAAPQAADPAPQPTAAPVDRPPVVGVMSQIAAKLDLPEPVETDPATATTKVAEPLKIPSTPAPAIAQPVIAQPTNDPAVATPAPIRVAIARSQASAPAAIAPALIARASTPALFALAGMRERDRVSDTDAATPFGAPTGAVLLQPADAAQLISKPGGAQGQALDMGRQDWPQKMIDRIETLRDGANATDTSIRLKPEALGRVDVSLKTHADGAVTVRFTAEQPATRTMIADAAPQLQAAAEARGIRLSGTSVDLSGSGNGNADRQQPRFELQQNTSNHLAAGGDDIEAGDDGRIA